MSPADPELRASDEERDRTAAQLREHFGTGRLSEDEFEQRSDAAYSARTVGELTALLRDLPALPSAPARPGHNAAREAARKRVLYSTGSGALVAVLCVAIWLATGAGYFWPMWVILGLGIRGLQLGWSELGPGADERRRLGQGSARQPGAPREPRQ